MKKIRLFLPLLAAFLLLSALPAFSGSGPYGNYGLSGSTVAAQGVETQHDATAGGSGPYGAVGPTFKGMGTAPTTVASGTGPYGAFGSSGMMVGSEPSQIARKNDCILTAKNCP